MTWPLHSVHSPNVFPCTYVNRPIYLISSKSEAIEGLIVYYLSQYYRILYSNTEERKETPYPKGYGYLSEPSLASLCKRGSSESMVSGPPPSIIQFDSLHLTTPPRKPKATITLTACTIRTFSSLFYCFLALPSSHNVFLHHHPGENRLWWREGGSQLLLVFMEFELTTTLTTKPNSLISQYIKQQVWS